MMDVSRCRCVGFFISLLCLSKTMLALTMRAMTHTRHARSYIKGLTALAGSYAGRSGDGRAAVTGILAQPKFLQVLWGDGHVSLFHHIWLRDNCPSCVHPTSRQV